MASYGDILSQYAATIQGVEQGYANLYQDVVGGLQGMEASALQKAKIAFETGEGNILASNVARGLGNSTIQGSMRTGLLGRYAEATGAIQSDFGQKLAAAKLQAGLPGLGYRGQAAQAYASLGGQFQSEQDRNALGYAQLASQKAIAGMRGGGGGGIHTEGVPQLRGGGGGGGGRGYGGDPGLTYAAGPTMGGYSSNSGGSSGWSGGYADPYLPTILSSGGDFGGDYGVSYGEY